MRIILAAFFFIGLCGVFLYYLPAITSYTYSLDQVDTGNFEEIREIPSPDGDKILTVYYRGGPFWFADYSFIGEVKFFGLEQETRVLYWHSNNRGQTLWEDNETIFMQMEDDVIYLNVYEDTYDFRKKN